MSFASLPPEIQTRILLHAVQPPHGRYGQTPTFALVSRACYSIISRLLWRHIRVTTPSALRQLHAALQLRPELAASTQSLHLGPDSEIYQRGWPLDVKEEEGRVSLLLMPTLPASLLPSWVEPGEAFDIKDPSGRDWREAGVNLAIKQAFEDLDVNPRRRGFSSGRGHPACRIGVRAWALRLWEAQAALDLFLAETRRLEDVQDSCGLRASLKSPSLSDEERQVKLRKLASIYDLEMSISDLCLPPVQPGNAQFYLTRGQLWSHISRRGGPMDHFDHLILFARSRREDLGMDRAEWRRLQHHFGGPLQGYFLSAAEASDNASNETEEDTLAEPLRPATDGAEELLKVAREVLALVPQVTNLSVTGFLHRALNALPASLALRQLNIGPIVPWWDDCLFFLSPGCRPNGGEDRSVSPEPSSEDADEGEGVMPRLERLRICGTISSRDAKKFASQLPSLREMVWEEASEIVDGGEKIIEAIQALQGQSRAPAPSKDGQERPQRYTEVRLRPTAELAGDISSEEVEAWPEGRLVAGTLHAINLVTSGNVVESEPPTWSDDEETAKNLHAESKEWWEEGRRGLGLHSELE